MERHTSLDIGGQLVRRWLSGALLCWGLAGSGQAALPGWHGVDHFGIAVPDIEQATHFLVEVIGCQRLITAGPFAGEGDWMTRQFDVHPRAKIRQLRMLRCGVGSNVELFEWDAPGQVQRYPKLSDFGGNHLAFYVDDLPAAIAYLKDHGAEVLNEPLAISEGDMAGDTIIYVKAPWGGFIELVTYPTGMGYEKHTDKRLWSTLRPGE